ncbi:recombinase family protein [Bacillus cytotoxicus]
MKTKVALYVRVSTEEQANNGYSIDAQLNTLRNHCEISGKTIVEEYADKGISGTSISGRHGLQKMLEDAKKGII